VLAADKPKEILDRATYNPVSMFGQVAYRKGTGQDAHRRWVDGLEQRRSIPQRRSIDFGSTAGSAVLVPKSTAIRSSVYCPSRPEWTALVTTGQQDHQGRGPQGQEGRHGARH
jgi:hypothetical protein